MPLQNFITRFKKEQEMEDQSQGTALLIHNAQICKQQNYLDSLME